jgi:type I site-specific restriction-modification system R (restriction) subunit
MMIFETDGKYEYRALLTEDNDRKLRLYRNSVFKSDLKPFFDMGMLEMKNGKLTMTDVGKRVHDYGKYCSLMRKGFFAKRPVKDFITSLTTVDSIPKVYEGKSRKKLVEMIKEVKSVYKPNQPYLWDAIIRNELMDELARLPETPLSEIESDVVFKLKLDRLYDKPMYESNREKILENVRSSIGESKTPAEKEVVRMETALGENRRVLEILEEKRKKGEAVLRELKTRPELIREALAPVDSEMAGYRRAIQEAEYSLLTNKAELAECDVILRNLEA